MIAVAAFSARALAEASAADGLAVHALDLFGDEDTRRAAVCWQAIGPIGPGLAIDGERLLAALRRLASTNPAPEGWIAGSGLEGRSDLLAQGQMVLPLLGTAPHDVRAVRDPRVFFGYLDELRLAHPPVRFDGPGPVGTWLMKDGAGCGGWHVRRAPPGSVMPELVSAGRYWQAEVPGEPMSATLLCNGVSAQVLGCNRQLVQAIEDLPYVFAGLVGPVPISRDLAAAVDDAAQRLSRRFAIRGLASLDFLLLNNEPLWLELNPRPTASLSLYPKIGGFGPVTAHLMACRHGHLPAIVDFDGVVRGQRIVFADHQCVLTPEFASNLAARGDTHDLPVAGTRVAAGAPICTLSANGHDADQVERKLQVARDDLLQTLSSHESQRSILETCP